MAHMSVLSIWCTVFLMLFGSAAPGAVELDSSTTSRESAQEKQVQLLIQRLAQRDWRNTVNALTQMGKPGLGTLDSDTEGPRHQTLGHSGQDH